MPRRTPSPSYALVLSSASFLGLVFVATSSPFPTCGQTNSPQTTGGHTIQWQRAVQSSLASPARLLRRMDIVSLTRPRCVDVGNGWNPRLRFPAYHSPSCPNWTGRGPDLGARMPCSIRTVVAVVSHTRRRPSRPVAAASILWTMGDSPPS
ncbi:hypothetical protein C8F01DRAFT_45941 [Mycena amicta]|nr:hypothetical protein C8F01DRAFT_45941 [Mycena amicta]